MSAQRVSLFSPQQEYPTVFLNAPSEAKSVRCSHREATFGPFWVRCFPFILTCTVPSLQEAPWPDYSRDIQAVSPLSRGACEKCGIDLFF